MAQEVGVITIEDAATDETWNSLNDVVAFLSSHGVSVKANVFPKDLMVDQSLLWPIRCMRI
jgi:hypothetical protein